VDWIQLDPVADSREHGNETSGFVKDGEFLRVASKVGSALLVEPSHTCVGWSGIPHGNLFCIALLFFYLPSSVVLPVYIVQINEAKTA
jgi:hypothetical protein